jgi:hypothetical protein
MVAETPEWSYWWAIADTRVKLSQCIALSLNVNPYLIDFRPGYIGDTGLWRLDPNSVNVFHARFRILTAYRQNGERFSADAPGRGERSVLLREFAGWALHKFTEPKIPKELAVLAAIGDSPLPEPQELANMVAAWRPQSAEVDSSEKVAIAKATKGPYLSMKEQQYGSILQAIRDLKHDPKRLPTGAEIRRQVWNKCERPGYKRGAFNKRWQELRDLSEIGDEPLVNDVG